MAERDDYTPAALYARVSSDRQDVDLSVSAQLRALRDHARKNGYMVVGEFVDEAESGRIADRPQFRKMIDEATKPEAPFRACLRSSTKGFDLARSKRYTGSTASLIVVYRSALRYYYVCRRTILPQTGAQRLLRQALQGNPRLEVLQVHPQARARRRLQVHAQA